MKKIILLLISSLGGTGVFCQVLINLQLPETGLTVKSQLWDMSLVNTSSQGCEVQLQMVMTDRSGSRPLLSATTRMFYLPKGVRQVRSSDILPLTYTVMDPGAGVDNSPGGFLPAGTFLFCYKVIQVGIEVPSAVGQECQDRQIEPIVPPVLISPGDSEKIEMPRPVFSWTPPMPGNIFSHIFYDWELVEVQGLQTGTEAIQQNIPVLYQYNIPSTNFPYPSSAPTLDSTKIYAWRVIAKNNNMPVSTSEVWNFSLKRSPDSSHVHANAAGFARLSLDNNSAFTICHGQLGYEFINEKNVRSADVAVFDISSGQKKNIPMDSATCKLRFGSNLNRLDLRETPGMTDGHFYLFELTDADGRKWYLKFQYKGN